MRTLPACRFRFRRMLRQFNESLLAIVHVGLTDTPIVLEPSTDAGRREIFIDQLALSM